MSNQTMFLILGVLVAVGAGVVLAMPRKPKTKPSSVGFDDSKPHVGVTVATGYNRVDTTAVTLDLNHLSGTDWQTHNTVVI